jgi:tape measure domain-containing protein
MSTAMNKLRGMVGLVSAGVAGIGFAQVARQIERATTQMNNINATMRVATGSASAASRQIGFIREEAQRLGLFFPSVAKQMAQFAAAARSANMTGGELRDIFTGISEASRAMGLTAPQAEGAMMALQQMMSKGKVSAEELRQQLGERMPGSIQIMASALDVTTSKLFEMMENGELLSDEVLPKFGRELQRVFGGQAALQADRIAASIQRLRTAFFDLMSQGDLEGAAMAIDELAEIISSDDFQESFDSFVENAAELGVVFADNIDGVVAFGKALAGIGIARVLSRLGPFINQLTSLVGKIIPTTAATTGLVGAMQLLTRGLGGLGGPAGLIVSSAAGLLLFRDRTEDAKVEARNLNAEIQRLQQGFIDTSIASLEYQRSLAQPDFEKYLQMSEELASLQQQLEEKLEGRSERGAFDITFGEKSVADLKEEIMLLKHRRSELEENSIHFTELTRMLKERREALKEATEEEEDYSDALKSLAELDPVFAATRELRSDLSDIDTVVERMGLSEQKAAELREDAYQRYKEAVKDAQNSIINLSESAQEFIGNISEVDLLPPGERDRVAELDASYRRAAEAVDILYGKTEDAGEESGSQFSEEFLEEISGLGESIGEAIVEGDWDSIGSTIGNLLGDSLGDVLSKEIGGTLSGIGEDLGGTAGRSIGSSIGTALGSALGGAAGAAAGSFIGQELEDFFSGSEYDLEAVQARQNTGTVLGSIDQKSSSIANSLEEIQGATDELVNINTGMLRSLQQVQNGITRASGRIAGQQPGAGIQAPAGPSQGEQALGGITATSFGLAGIGAISLNPITLAGGLINEVLGGPLDGLLEGIAGFVDDIFGGVFSDIGGAIFGGGTSVVDRGVQIIGGEIGARMDETLIRAFARIKEDGGWFSSDDYYNRFAGVPDDVNRQFQLVLGEIVYSVRQGAEALGVLPQNIQQRLDDFVLKTRKISLKGLDADEQQEEIQAAFSAIFDRLAGAVVPFAKDFQNAGEGIGETIARLATQVGVFEELALTLGESIESLTGRSRTAAATDLAQSLGGTENFAQAIATLEDNFFTEAEQFEANSRRLKSALDDLPLPDTRKGFLDLIKAQDEATKSGRENIATLLRLQGSADEYYSYLEGFTKELNETASSLRLEGAQQSVRPSAAFERGLQQAIAGDEEALQSLPRLAKELSSARMDQASTLAEARAANARIASQLENVSDNFSGQRSHLNVAEDQLEKMSQQENLLQQIADNTRPPDDAQGYRNGGIASGPQSGYTAMLHGTEAVIPLNGEKIPLEVNNEEMINELRNLRNEVNQLRDEQSQSQYQITKNTKRTRDTLEKFDIEGLPPERT